MKGTFRGALFDLDGTLLNSEPYYTEFWNEIAAKFRPDITDLPDKCRGITPAVSIARFFPNEEDRITIARLLSEGEKNMTINLFPGSMDYIRDLKSHGIKCALVTSSDQPKIKRLFSKLPEFRNLFDYVITSEEFGRPKPAPDCFLKAAANLGIPADECIAYEDSIAGLKAATDAGAFTIGMITTNPLEVMAPICNYPLSAFPGFTYEDTLSIFTNS